MTCYNLLPSNFKFFPLVMTAGQFFFSQKSLCTCCKGLFLVTRLRNFTNFFFFDVMLIWWDWEIVLVVFVFWFSSLPHWRGREVSPNRIITRGRRRRGKEETQTKVGTLIKKPFLHPLESSCSSFSLMVGDFLHCIFCRWRQITPSGERRLSLGGRRIKMKMWTLMTLMMMKGRLSRVSSVCMLCNILQIPTLANPWIFAVNRELVFRFHVQIKHIILFWALLIEELDKQEIELVTLQINYNSLSFQEH